MIAPYTIQGRRVETRHVPSLGYGLYPADDPAGYPLTKDGVLGGAMRWDDSDYLFFGTAEAAIEAGRRFAAPPPTYEEVIARNIKGW